MNAIMHGPCYGHTQITSLDQICPDFIIHTGDCKILGNRATVFNDFSSSKLVQNSGENRWACPNSFAIPSIYVCVYLCSSTHAWWLATATSLIESWLSCPEFLRMPVWMYCDLQNNWESSNRFRRVLYQFTTEKLLKPVARFPIILQSPVCMCIYAFTHVCVLVWYVYMRRKLCPLWGLGRHQQLWNVSEKRLRNNPGLHLMWREKKSGAKWIFRKGPPIHMALLKAITCAY